ncbi:MAG: hypothetical protein GY941_06125 [Planctomycetes bacterium]|nr:hypothetical protein [Planctomycetota bacterium]
MMDRIKTSWDDVFPEADKAFARMKRAYDRGTGCRLTPKMCAELGNTFLSNLFADYEDKDGLED